MRIAIIFLSALWCGTAAAQATAAPPLDAAVQGITVPKGLGDARRGCRGPRAYRSHHRLVAALDGAGLGRSDGRDNLDDVPVRDLDGAVSSASAGSTYEEPRRDRGAPVLLREWA
jgi:hypothetical protein